MWSNVLQLRSRYNRGGRPGPARRACGASGVTSPRAPAGAPRAASRGAVMSHASEHVDLVALSLLPIRCRRRVGALLHEGRPPGAILELAIAECLPQARPAPDALRSRALAALARGASRGIALVPWSDAAYPAALAAISDPPPVLWARGNLAALTRPAVAIVGSRSGSPYRLTSRNVSRPTSPRAASSWSAASRAAWIRRHTAARWRRRMDRHWPSSAPASTSSIRRSTATSRAASRPTAPVLSELVPGTPPRNRSFRCAIASSAERTACAAASPHELAERRRRRPRCGARGRRAPPDRRRRRRSRGRPVSIHSPPPARRGVPPNPRRARVG